jgi:hypothetical protein
MFDGAPTDLEDQKSKSCCWYLEVVSAAELKAITLRKIAIRSVSA